MTVDFAASNQAVIDPLDITVSDVTGLKTLELEGVDGHRSVKDVSATIAEVLDLSTEVPWALRDNGTARMLVEDHPLGIQVKQNAELVAIPKSHLG